MPQMYSKLREQVGGIEPCSQSVCIGFQTQVPTYVFFEYEL